MNCEKHLTALEDLTLSRFGFSLQQKNKQTWTLDSCMKRIVGFRPFQGQHSSEDKTVRFESFRPSRVPRLVHRPVGRGPAGAVGLSHGVGGLLKAQRGQVAGHAETRG